MKRGESDCFRVDGGVRQGCMMFPLLFSVYVDLVMKDVKMRMGRMGVKFLEERGEGNSFSSCMQIT